MQREQVIEIAKQAGFSQHFEPNDKFERFSALIEAETIERCYSAVNGVMVTDHSANTFQRCLKAIRSLK